MNIADIEIVRRCKICQKWIDYCLREPSYDNSHIYNTWLNEKRKYWKANSEHLEKMGFNYDAGLCKALDYIEISKHQREDLEGCLLVIKVGSDKKPATPKEIEVTHKVIKDALAGVRGVKVIITQHSFTMDKVALPQLRRLQSEILTSFEPEENSNPIISNLEV